MAESASHKFGELIGDKFEAFIARYLKERIRDTDYYVDYNHERPTRDNSSVITMVDLNGNKHKLDIVIEKGGSETEQGEPRAFVEVAWRRYTKHSKNKVQEISGAITPLVQTYKEFAPFYAAALSGAFTKNSIQQLRSEGFYVLYIPYERMQESYAEVGASIEWEESTPESSLMRLYRSINAFTEDQNERLYQDFIRRNAVELDHFAEAIETSLMRTIESIKVIPTHGRAIISSSVKDACAIIDRYDESEGDIPIRYYEVSIEYNTGEVISYRGSNKISAIQFLNRYK